MSGASEAILDANGDPVDLPPEVPATDALRAFMAGRVPAACGHYITAQEARAGYTSCEACS